MYRVHRITWCILIPTNNIYIQIYLILKSCVRSWRSVYQSPILTGDADNTWSTGDAGNMHLIYRWCRQNLIYITTHDVDNTWSTGDVDNTWWWCWQHLIYVFYKLLYRPKHPIKVHFWAGISLKGPTKIVIFEGIMDVELYVKIIKEALLPFIKEKFTICHCFMQGNDRKHTSKRAQKFLEDNKVENCSWITRLKSNRKFVARVKRIHLKRSQATNERQTDWWYQEVLGYCGTLRNSFHPRSHSVVDL